MAWPSGTSVRRQLLQANEDADSESQNARHDICSVTAAGGLGLNQRSHGSLRRFAEGSASLLRLLMTESTQVAAKAVRARAPESSSLAASGSPRPPSQHRLALDQVRWQQALAAAGSGGRLASGWESKPAEPAEPAEPDPAESAEAAAVAVRRFLFFLSGFLGAFLPRTAWLTASTSASCHQQR